MDRFVVISGCSGGGKSTLLTELARRGMSTVAEPGLRLLRAAEAGSGDPLPWDDPHRFVQRAAEVLLEDRAAAAALPGWVFFDRGLVDAASAMERFGETGALETLGMAHRYHRTVFLAPPWPEIYVTDADRRHGFDAALGEYERLARDYPALSYTVVELPRVSVAERADFILARLGPPPA